MWVCCGARLHREFQFQFSSSFSQRVILLRLCLESPLLNIIHFKTINDADYLSSLYLKIFLLVEISCVFQSKDFGDRKYLLPMWLSNTSHFITYYSGYASY